MNSKESASTAWRVHGERTVYDNEWVQVALADVEPPGGERFEHHVVRLRPAAVTMLLDERDRVLMIWRHRFVSDRWGWELPGGLVDAGEEPRQAAVRELREEVGYRASRLRHVTRFQPLVGAVDAWRDVFVGTGPVRVSERWETAEVERMTWIPLSSVMGMVTEGAVWNADTVIALLFVLAERGCRTGCDSRCGAPGSGADGA
ncbi:NUDIX hydrolase [Streptomyces polyrhachis]|uniref:NUDIX hydrolase n=1 Tax=Streptomyces polyrhachis TaxID=1282885 RepID=A0ABW2GDX0_9ACTN